MDPKKSSLQDIPSVGTVQLVLENLLLMVTRGHRYAHSLQFPNIPFTEAWKYRSMPLRHVECGSCGGCERALTRLENSIFDVKKFNIHFEAAARNSHFLVVTGAWTRNSIEAARENWKGMSISALIVFGDCAINGGPFRDSYAVVKREDVVPEGLIWAEIKGCPPSPIVALRQLLVLRNRFVGIGFHNRQEVQQFQIRSNEPRGAQPVACAAAGSGA